MKKLTALILVLLMVMSLGVTAYADDGSQTTTVTVTVAAGTYTVTVPEDITFDLSTVLTATATGDGYNDENKIGSVHVSDVSNCRYIKCTTTAPVLTNGTDTLGSSVYATCLSAQTFLAGPDPRTYAQGVSFDYYPYYTGRRWGSDPAEASDIVYWLQLPKHRLPLLNPAPILEQ